MIARRIGSQALRASAVDSIGDMCATGAVVAAMFLSKITGPLTDAVLGCIIAVYILVLGIKHRTRNLQHRLSVGSGNMTEFWESTTW